MLLTYETIRRWCRKFGQSFANSLRRRRPRRGDKWHLDEVFVRIQGELHYLWRAVDQDGVVLDILVQRRRSTKAAKRFFKRLLRGPKYVPRELPGKRALRLASSYAHARQMRRARREIKRLKTYLGRVARDVSRKLATRPGLAPHFAQPLARVQRLLAQQKTDHAKLYSLHAPEVECLAKGKAHKRYEFGVKVSVAATNREGLILSMQALPGNPYDGHTLGAALAQAERISGTKVARAYVDRGYRGHGLDARRVFISGQRRGLTATIRRELKCRSAIEAGIGHMKTDGRLDRNYLAGTDGDAINALLCGAGYNLRLLLNFLGALLRALLRWLTVDSLAGIFLLSPALSDFSEPTSLAEGIEFLLTGEIVRRQLMASAQDEFADARNVYLPV